MLIQTGVLLARRPPASQAAFFSPSGHLVGDTSARLEGPPGLSAWRTTSRRMTWRRGLVLLIAAATAHADGAKTAADPLLNGVAMRLTAYKQAADLLGRRKTIVSAPAFLISRPGSKP